MAVKQSILNEIPQRNKDLAFGYVKECDKENKTSIPNMIKYICLIYLNQNKDKFDSKNAHKEIRINGDTIETTTYDIISSLLENVVNVGIHIWRFKCNSRCYRTFDDCDTIGITKCMELGEKETYLDYDHGKCIGYIFGSDGVRSDPNDPNKWQEDENGY